MIVPIIVYTKSGDLMKMDKQFLLKTQPTFKGWYCSTHLNLIYISWHGGVRSAVCGNSYLCNNIYDPNKKINFSYSNICMLKSNLCYCEADINLPKAVDKLTCDEMFKEIKNFELDSLEKLELLPECTDSNEVIGIVDLELFLHNNFSIHLNLGKRCNFDCSYCPANVHNNYDPDVNYDKLIYGINRSLETFCSDLSRPKDIILTGGEPTLHKRYDDIIAFLKEKGFKISVSTNGTAPLRKYSKSIENYDVHYAISFHREFTNPKLMRKINKLYEKYQSNLTVKSMSDLGDKFSEKIKNNVDPLLFDNIAWKKIIDYNSINFKVIDKDF